MAASKPLRVLVVDDDAGVLRAVGSVVEGLGHRSLPAGDRDEALHVVRAVPIDFSILDVHVHEDDGLKILGSLRAVVGSLPAIIMSGNLTSEVVERATSLGQVGWLLDKPLDVALLRRAITSLILDERL